ncbi:MAG: gliding motility protein, partial [Deltaproteobacteria bacterium]|nr:gliding motility protein [Deltaproteobacteria bacterium]
MTSTPTSPEALSLIESQLSDPTRRTEAARALAPLYRAAGDHAKLLSALEALATSSPDTAECASALKQAAQVYLSDLKQPDLALTTASRALALPPGETGLFEVARPAAELAGQLDTFSSLLEELAEEAPPSSRAALHRELAELQERLGDRDAAMLHLRAAAQADPNHAETLQTLLRIYRGQEQWAALAEALEKASHALPDRLSQLGALREAASTHELKLDDKESSLTCWMEIVQREPTDREAAMAAERLASTLDRPQELITALQAQRMVESPGPRQRELTVKLAQIKLERLGEVRPALELCRLVLEQDSAHAGARRIAEACALRPGDEGAAALAMLDDPLARHGDHEARVALRERRLASVADEEKPALFAQIRDLCERHLHQPERAFLAGLRVFASGVDRDKLRPELERLAEQTDSLEELAEVFEATAEELMPGDALNGPLYRSAARIRDRLSEPEAATRLWNELLAESPGDREALERLAKLYEATHDARSLAEVNARKAKLATDPGERAALLEKAGAAREAAGEDEGAIEDYRAALAIRASPGLLSALDRLYGRTHRLGEQADAISQLLALATDPDDKRALRLRSGKLLEKEGQGPAALRVWAAMLAETPSDVDAISGLERLLERDDVCQEAASLLEGIYRRSGNTRALADVLELRVEPVAAADRVGLLLELASLREQLGEHEAAFDCRARAFCAQPEDRAVRAELERAAEASSSFDALVSAYEDALERGVGEPLATELWRRVAALYSERLRRPELAARALAELVRRSPDDLDLLRQLVDTHRSTSSFRPLVEALMRLATAEASGEAKAELFFEAAQVAEDALADKDLAVACYRKVLDHQPADRNAVKLLERLLGETGQHEALATLLEGDIRHAAGDPEEIAQLQTTLARLKARHLKDPRGALRLLVPVLAASPFHRGASELVEELAGREGPAREEAATLLETMLEGGGDEGRLIATLEARLAAQPSHSERVVLLRKLAVVRARRQGNFELGFQAAAKALREAPGDAASLQLCLELASEADTEKELAKLLAELAPLAIGSATRAALFRSLARLQLESGNEAAAEKSLREVLEVLPDDREASQGLEILFERLDRPREHVALLRRRLSGVRESAERLPLLQRIADLWVRAGENAAAADALREACAIEPNRQILASLEALLGKLGRFEEQAEVLHRLASTAPPAEARELLNRRGGALSAAGQVDLASATWGQVLGRWQADPDAIAGLEGLLAKAKEGDPARREAAKLLEAAYRAKGDPRRYVEMLELRLEGAPASDRTALLREIASIREDLGDTTLAFSACRRLFAEAPEDA